MQTIPGSFTLQSLGYERQQMTELQGGSVRPAGPEVTRNQIPRGAYQGLHKNKRSKKKKLSLILLGRSYFSAS